MVLEYLHKIQYIFFSFFRELNFLILSFWLLITAFLVKIRILLFRIHTHHFSMRFQHIVIFFSLSSENIHCLCVTNSELWGWTFILFRQKNDFFFFVCFLFNVSALNDWFVFSENLKKKGTGKTTVFWHDKYKYCHVWFALEPVFFSAFFFIYNERISVRKGSERKKWKKLLPKWKLQFVQYHFHQQKHV